LNKRVSAEALVTIGTFIIMLSYLALLIPNPVLAYSCAVLYALGNGLMWPSFLSLLADHAGEEHQGYIQGIGNSVGSLASIIGLLLGGLLFRPLGQQIFWLPAALVLTVALMSFGLTGHGIRRRAELDQNAVR
jgi:MFS family permease